MGSAIALREDFDSAGLTMTYKFFVSKFRVGLFVLAASLFVGACPATKSQIGATVPEVIKVMLEAKPCPGRDSRKGIYSTQYGKLYLRILCIDGDVMKGIYGGRTKSDIGGYVHFTARKQDDGRFLFRWGKERRIRLHEGWKVILFNDVQPGQTMLRTRDLEYVNE